MVLFKLKKLRLMENISIPFFRQHICKSFVTNAIFDRRLRSDISKIWGTRDSKKIICIITGIVCSGHCVLCVVCCKHWAGLTLAERSALPRWKCDNVLEEMDRFLWFLVKKTSANGDDFLIGAEIYRWISMQTAAPLYPKCAISQTMEIQRSINIELQYKAKQDLISVSEKIYCDIFVI